MDVASCSSHLIKFQDYLTINFSGKDQWIFEFFISDCTIFYQQCLWKEWIGISDFLHGHIHQGKVACETITFGQVRSSVRLVQSDYRILWSSKSLVEWMDTFAWPLSFYLSFSLFSCIFLSNLAGVHLVNYSAANNFSNSFTVFLKKRDYLPRLQWKKVFMYISLFFKKTVVLNLYGRH